MTLDRTPRPRQAAVPVGECVRRLRLAVPGLQVVQASDRWHETCARAELRNWHAVQYLYLLPLGSTRLALYLYPGDTLEQARVLYDSPDRVRRLLALREHGWDLQPDFHFGHIRKHLTCSPSQLSADDYTAYWVKRISDLGIIRRNAWDSTLSQLIADGIFDPSRRAEFHRDFTYTRRDYASPRPGIRLSHEWDASHALSADFPMALRTAIQQALTTLEEHEAASLLAVAGPVK